jgi:uncharacterized RDD family membrane protein YckC
MNSSEVRYGGFWRRLGAGAIDFVILLPLTLLAAELDTRSRVTAIVAAVLTQALYYMYILPLTARFGGTLGKLALGLRVAPAEGGPLLWGHVWRRSAVDLGASALIVAGTVAGLGRVPFAEYSAAPWHSRSALLEAAVPWYAWTSYLYLAWLASEFVVMLLNPRRRALHDFLAGTVVVVARSRAAAPAAATRRVSVS